MGDETRRALPKRDAMGGREIPARKMEFYERGNARSDTGQGYAQGPWERPPTPGPNTRGMSQGEIDQFYKDNPPKMAQGGKVKCGSPTRCVPTYKHK